MLSIGRLESRYQPREDYCPTSSTRFHCKTNILPRLEISPTVSYTGKYVNNTTNQLSALVHTVSIPSNYRCRLAPEYVKRDLTLPRNRGASKGILTYSTRICFRAPNEVKLLLLCCTDACCMRTRTVWNRTHSSRPRSPLHQPPTTKEGRKGRGGG